MKWATVYVYDSREAVDPIVAEASDFMFPWPPSWTFDKEKARGWLQAMRESPTLDLTEQTLDRLAECAESDPIMVRVADVVASDAPAETVVAELRSLLDDPAPTQWERAARHWKGEYERSEDKLAAITQFCKQTRERTGRPMILDLLGQIEAIVKGDSA